MKKFKEGSLGDLAKIRRRLQKAYERGEVDAAESRLINDAINKLAAEIENTN